MDVRDSHQQVVLMFNLVHFARVQGYHDSKRIFPSCQATVPVVLNVVDSLINTCDLNIN